MMDLYFMIAILLANIISIAIVYQFIKKLEKKQKLIFVAISVATMYILVSLVYWISGFGIDKNIHEASKNFILFLFVPVNVILIIPFFAFQYMKFKNKQIKIDNLIKKASTLVVLLIIVLIIEYFYFCDIQTNIKYMNDNKNKEEVQNLLINEISTNETSVNETIVNEFIVNETMINETISNEIQVNELD